MPFLPGDSLLFASGALAASTGAMDPWVLIPLLFTAAVLGDTLNYHIGKYIGPRVFEIESRFINKNNVIISPGNKMPIGPFVKTAKAAPR